MLATPQRILVIGCSGAGKSTLAKALAAHYSLPVVHLDAYYWQPGWIPLGAAEWAAEVERLIAAPAWVMDGNFSASMARRAEFADAIVHVDFPRWLCLWRILRRVVFSYGRTRPDMAPGCPEKFDWEFLKWVWNFRRRSRPKNLALLATYRGVVVTLAGPADVRRWQESGYRFGAAG